MLFAHKFIDAVRVEQGAGMQTIGPGSVEEVVRLIRKAEKFDFGEVPVEPGSKEGSYRVPKLTSDEEEAFREGLSPLPAPLCWYECCVTATVGRPQDRKGILVAARSRTCIETRAVVEWIPPRILVFTHRESIEWASFEPRPRMEGPFKNLSERDFLVNHFGNDTIVASYLTLMLNSRSTRVTTEEPPERLNRARVKRGDEPLAAHRVVTIVPREYIDAGERGEGGHHRSPRLHWRRSHIRHLASGKKALIPRCLVGRAELGDVTHEYRVKLS